MNYRGLTSSLGVFLLESLLGARQGVTFFCLGCGYFVFVSDFVCLFLLYLRVYSFPFSRKYTLPLLLFFASGT